MKQIWAKRVAVFEYIFSCLLREETDSSVIIYNFQKYDQYNKLDEWQLKIVKMFAQNYFKYENLIKNNLKTKWSYDEFDNIAKAVIFEALAEWEVHKTQKAILIDQSLITIDHYSDKHLKKIVHAILDKILI
ncbi:DUF1948 domain-containing protein [Mycoplasmoides alvi]|uniref:DUF1948 domain-containing protein n=1 Tax=Mycoplasmoides alvi TaxID=78580 RepID=UPI00051B2CD7|nr:DUF1948 domain-containing protein [Mycoplasmoides alvi]